MAAFVQGIIPVTIEDGHIVVGVPHRDLSTVVGLGPRHGAVSGLIQHQAGEASVDCHVGIAGQGNAQDRRGRVGHRDGLNLLRDVVSAVFRTERAADGVTLRARRRNHLIGKGHVDTRVTVVDGGGQLEVSHHVLRAGNHGVGRHVGEGRIDEVVHLHHLVEAVAHVAADVVGAVDEHVVIEATAAHDAVLNGHGVEGTIVPSVNDGIARRVQHTGQFREGRLVQRIPDPLVAADVDDFVTQHHRTDGVAELHVLVSRVGMHVASGVHRRADPHTLEVVNTASAKGVDVDVLVAELAAVQVVVGATEGGHAEGGRGRVGEAHVIHIKGGVVGRGHARHWIDRVDVDVKGVLLTHVAEAVGHVCDDLVRAIVLTRQGELHIAVGNVGGVQDGEGEFSAIQHHGHPVEGHRSSSAFSEELDLERRIAHIGGVVFEADAGIVHHGEVHTRGIRGNEVARNAVGLGELEPRHTSRGRQQVVVIPSANHRASTFNGDGLSKAVSALGVAARGEIGLVPGTVLTGEAHVDASSLPGPILVGAVGPHNDQVALDGRSHTEVVIGGEVGGVQVAIQAPHVSVVDIHVCASCAGTGVGTARNAHHEGVAIQSHGATEIVAGILTVELGLQHELGAVVAVDVGPARARIGTRSARVDGVGRDEDIAAEADALAVQAVVLSVFGQDLHLGPGTGLILEDVQGTLPAVGVVHVGSHREAVSFEGQGQTELIPTGPTVGVGSGQGLSQSPLPTVHGVGVDGAFIVIGGIGGRSADEHPGAVGGHGRSVGVAHRVEVDHAEATRRGHAGAVERLLQLPSGGTAAVNDGLTSIGHAVHRIGWGTHDGQITSHVEAVAIQAILGHVVGHFLAVGIQHGLGAFHEGVPVGHAASEHLAHHIVTARCEAFKNGAVASQEGHRDAIAAEGQGLTIAEGRHFQLTVGHIGGAGDGRLEVHAGEVGHLGHMEGDGRVRAALAVADEEVNVVFCSTRSAEVDGEGLSRNAHIPLGREQRVGQGHLDVIGFHVVEVVADVNDEVCSVLTHDHILDGGGEVHHVVLESNEEGAVCCAASGSDVHGVAVGEAFGVEVLVATAAQTGQAGDVFRSLTGAPIPRVCSISTRGGQVEVSVGGGAGHSIADDGADGNLRDLRHGHRCGTESATAAVAHAQLVIAGPQHFQGVGSSRGIRRVGVRTGPAVVHAAEASGEGRDRTEGLAFTSGVHGRGDEVHGGLGRAEEVHCAILTVCAGTTFTVRHGCRSIHAGSTDDDVASIVIEAVPEIIRRSASTSRNGLGIGPSVAVVKEAAVGCTQCVASILLAPGSDQREVGVEVDIRTEAVIATHVGRSQRFRNGPVRTVLSAKEVCAARVVVGGRSSRQNGVPIDVQSGTELARSIVDNQVTLLDVLTAIVFPDGDCTGIGSRSTLATGAGRIVIRCTDGEVHATGGDGGTVLVLMAETGRTELLLLHELARLQGERVHTAREVRRGRADFTAGGTDEQVVVRISDAPSEVVSGVGGSARVLEALDQRPGTGLVLIDVDDAVGTASIIGRRVTDKQVSSAKRDGRTKGVGVLGTRGLEVLGEDPGTVLLLVVDVDFALAVQAGGTSCSHGSVENNGLSQTGVIRSGHRAVALLIRQAAVVVFVEHLTLVKIHALCTDGERKNGGTS